MKYFDYVGGLKNFAWVGNIYEQVADQFRITHDSTSSGGDTPREKMRLIGSSIGDSVEGNATQITLASLGLEIAGLQASLPDILLASREQLQALWNNGQDEQILEENL